jgi:superfamily II DNA helicase RecQ
MTSPENLMDEHGPFVKLWKKKPRSNEELTFTQRLLYVVIDEAHLIGHWSKFRGSYSLLYRLRAFIAEHIPILAPSATYDLATLNAVKDSLQLRKLETFELLRPNDRSNVYLSARIMQYPASSFRDLEFVLNVQPPKTRPDTFLVFLRTTEATVDAALALRRKLPEKDRCNIVWYNASMSRDFREQAAQDLREKKIWGFCSTEAFGTVWPIPSIHCIRFSMSYLPYSGC